MFSSEDEIIHHVRSVLNASVNRDHLPNLPGAGGKKGPSAGGGSGVEDQVGKWKKLFHYYDDDKGGALNFKEFRKLVRTALHVSESKLPDKDLKLLFERIDFNNSGEIDFEEFYKYIKLHTKENEDLPRTLGRALRLALARLRVRTEEDLRGLFNNLDFDADGGITLHQLRRLIREELRLNKYEFSDYYVKRLMHSIDLDNTGQIEFDEFSKFINDHVTLGGIAEATQMKVGKRLSKPYGNEVVSRMNMLDSFPADTEHLQQHFGGGGGEKHGHGGKGDASTPTAKPLIGQTAPYTGSEKPRGYFTLPGAKRLNRVEERLFDAGFDIRGKYFKVSEEASENALGGGKYRQQRPSRLPTVASAPSLKLPLIAKAAGEEGGGKVRNLGLRTAYLREVAKDIL